MNCYVLRRQGKHWKDVVNSKQNRHSRLYAMQGQQPPQMRSLQLAAYSWRDAGWFPIDFLTQSWLSSASIDSFSFKGVLHLLSRSLFRRSWFHFHARTSLLLWSPSISPPYPTPDHDDPTSLHRPPRGNRMVTQRPAHRHHGATTNREWRKANPCHRSSARRKRSTHCPLQACPRVSAALFASTHPIQICQPLRSAVVWRWSLGRLAMCPLASALAAPSNSLTSVAVINYPGMTPTHPATYAQKQKCKWQKTYANGTTETTKV